MKKYILITTMATLALNGCANMSKEQQAMLAGVAGALGGAAIGAAAGGGKGAAIGAAAGGVLAGVATYAFASDPYTQSVSRQANDWQEQTGARPEAAKVSQIVENGEKRQQINQQDIMLTDEQMVSGQHLSRKVRDQLKVARNESLKVGGNVNVTCPVTASQTVLSDIEKTGVTYSQDATMNTGYVITLSRVNQGSGYQL